MAKKIKTGRKKVDPAEKVILVGFYTKQKVVNQIGGMERAREIAKNTVESWVA
jgi:hypothetical protein